VARCHSRGGSSLNDFEVKDSGKRLEFEGGMVRDTTEGKINYMLIRPGPMFKRWAAHLSRAAAKYDNTRKPGEPRNWQLARGLAEFERFQESAARHFEQWLNGDRDEDHAAGVFFNINGAEYVLEQIAQDASKPTIIAPCGALMHDEGHDARRTHCRPTRYHVEHAYDA
jgi:hypothetical protein